MTKKLTIDILAKDKTKQALSGVQKNLGNLKKSVFSLKGALVGLGAGAVVKSFVDVGKEVESLQVRFKFLFGSVEEGQIAFDNLAKFAGRVPFSLEEISRASGNLAVVADDANDLNRILEITGNVAAVTGLDFETTSSQIQRAFSGGIGAADLFRERGVRALLGFKNGAKVTAEETVARFEELFAGDGQFANATKDLATTLEGTLSMIGDKYFNFQKDVAAGFFEELKGEFGDLNVFLEQNEQQIKDIATAIGENFAGAITKTSSLIKDVAPAVKNISDALGTTIIGFQSLPTFVQSSGIIAALLFGKKGLAAFSAVSFLVGQIDEIIDKAGAGTVRPLIDAEEADNAVKKLEQINGELELLELKLGGLGEREEDRELFNNLTDDAERLQASINKFNFDRAVEEMQKFNDVFRFTKTSISDVEKEQVKQQQTLKLSASMMESGARSMHNLSFAQERATVTLQGYNSEMAILGTVSTRHIEEQLSAFERFNEGFKNAMDKSTFDGFQRAGETAFNSLKKTMADFVITGKLDMKGFGDAVKRALVEALIGQAVTAALSKAKILFKMDAIKKALINTYEAGTRALAQGGVFGPFLAAGVIATGIGMVNRIKGFEKGGRPPVGQPSIIGEAGPELFIPQQAGTIIPNNKLGNMGQTTVNVNIMANDTEGFDDLLLKRRSVIVNVINDALNTQGKEALI